MFHFKVKTWNFTERDVSKDFTCSSRVKYMKIYPDIVIKTSKLHYWDNIDEFIANSENAFVSCFWLILETTSQIISQNFQSIQEKYLEKIFKMEFKISFQNILKRYPWSSVIVKPLPLRFTVILLGSETYNFMERYYDLWSFIPDLGLFSTISEFKR